MATAVLTYRNGVDLDALGHAVAQVRDDPTAGSTTVRSRSDWQGGLRATARVGDHAPIASDTLVPSGPLSPEALAPDALTPDPLAPEHDVEPDRGPAPSPVELLLAALGNCIAASYATNAAASGISIEALTVEVEGDLDLRGVLGLALSGAGVDRIRVRVHVDSSAPRELVEELHCGVTRTSPVHHSLTKPVPVDIELV